MSRLDYYRTAIASLGLPSVVRRAIGKKFGNGDLELTSRRLLYPVHARRGTSDLSVFDQIFVEREYRCLDHLSNIRNIVDLGANCGYSSAYLLSRFTDARVIAIEPDAQNFAVLVKNLKPYGDRAIALKGAVWSDCRDLFFDDQSLGSGQEWGRRTVEMSPGEHRPIPAWDIPTIMLKAGFDRVDILKIDVEGAEQAVFNADNLEWLNAVRNIVIELHGPACEEAFHTATEKIDFQRSRCGELTVCLQ